MPVLRPVQVLGVYRSRPHWEYICYCTVVGAGDERDTERAENERIGKKPWRLRSSSLRCGNTGELGTGKSHAVWLFTYLL